MRVDEFDLSEAWGLVYVNGQLVDAGSASVSAFDRGLHYGDGIYETVRVYAGAPFRLCEHLRRMCEGCRAIRLDPPDTGEVAMGVHRVLEANGLSDAYLRITVTRGVTGRLWYDLSSSNPTVVIFAKPFHRPDFEEGMRLMVSSYRTDERSLLSGIKQIGILSKILARAEAVDAGVDDALLLDSRGFVSEATSSNIFWVREGKLYTPGLCCGILPGITRSAVMEIARDNGIEVIEGEFPLDQVLCAEEVFLTSSTWEIAPVLSLAERSFPGSNGPSAQQMEKLYQRLAGRDSNKDEQD